MLSQPTITSNVEMFYLDTSKKFIALFDECLRSLNNSKHREISCALKSPLPFFFFFVVGAHPDSHSCKGGRSMLKYGGSFNLFTLYLHLRITFITHVGFKFKEFTMNEMDLNWAPQQGGTMFQSINWNYRHHRLNKMY